MLLSAGKLCGNVFLTVVFGGAAIISGRENATLVEGFQNRGLCARRVFLYHPWGVSCAEPHVTHGTGPSHSPHHRHGSHVTHFPNGAPHHYVCVTYRNPHIYKHTHMHLFIDAAIYL